MVDELALTGNARGGRSLRVGFRCAMASPELFDGLYKRIGFNAYERVHLDFDEPVVVSRVSVLYQLEAAEAQQGGHEVSVSVLSDGAETVRAGPARLNAPCEFHPLLDAGDNLVWAQEAICRFDKPAGGTTAILELRKPTVAIGDIVVWGLPARLVEQASRPGMPIGFTAEENTHSSIRVRWSEPPEPTAYVRVRFRRAGTRVWSRACYSPSQREAVLLALEPQSIYEVTVEAVGTARGKGARPVRVALPNPVAVRTVADVFGVNFFPGGGAGYQMHPDETANTRAVLHLMRQAGVRHVRWWINSPGSVQVFAENGIALLPSSENAKQSQHGVWMVHTQNEPDFANVFPEELARQIRERRKAMNTDDPRTLLAAPEVGGDLIGPGSEYIHDLYRTGVKGLFQVMSVHPYVKTSSEIPPGGIPCCPEALVPAIQSLRAVMREFGDLSKPIIATECIGYGTFEGANHYPWIPPVTAERQAAWMVRSHLLMIALGLARIYHYPFQDEGTDVTQITHNAGLVDWHGKPKLAYQAYCTMTSLLGPTRSDGLQAEVKPPVFGARFMRPNGECLTALWDCGGTSRVAVEAAVGVSSVKSMMGEAVPAPVPIRNRLLFTVDEAPIWVYSTWPLRILSQKRTSPPIEPQLRFRLKEAAVRVQPSRLAYVTAIVEHNFAEPQQVVVELQSPWARSERFSQSAVVRPGEEMALSVSIPCPSTAERKRIHSWGVTCRYGSLGHQPIRSEERHLYLMVPDQ